MMITTKIRSGISKFAHKTGKAPDYVYLGISEWLKLHEENLLSNEVDGIEIITVHIYTHLSFGIKADEY